MKISRLVVGAATLLALLPGAGEAQVADVPSPPTGQACAFNTTLPTYNSGQAGWIQCDNRGRLIISNPGSGGGGGGGGAVYGPDATGGPPTQPPVQSGFTDASGNVTRTSPNTPLPTQDQNAKNTIGTVGGSTTSAQSVQAPDGSALAKDGTDGTSAPSVTSAGTGIRGWLSSILLRLNGILSVKVDQTTPGTTNGVALVDPITGTLIVRAANAAVDGQAGAAVGLVTNSRCQLLNGTVWDRCKGTNGNQNSTVIPQSAAGLFSGVAVTTSSAAGTGGLAAATRKTLWLKNQSTTATISVCPNNINGGVAAAATAGCTDLKPGDAVNMCTDAFCPGDLFNVIGSASAPLTVLSN